MSLKKITVLKPKTPAKKKVTKHAPKKTRRPISR